MRVTAWHLDSTTKTPQEPPWAALSGACPECGRLLAHLEGKELCLACAWSDLPGEFPAPCDPQEPATRTTAKGAGRR